MNEQDIQFMEQTLQEYINGDYTWHDMQDIIDGYAIHYYGPAGMEGLNCISVRMLNEIARRLGMYVEEYVEEVE